MSTALATSDVRFCHQQYPVGQGGFHAGRIRLETDFARASFRWAFDCGSAQLAPLKREIRRAVRKKFDLLFLSHLDSDHISGVDFLLGSADVDEVVLPYIGDHDRALLLAGAASSGALSGNYISMLADPLLWFADRGVERVTYIDSEANEGEDSFADVVEPSPDVSFADGNITRKWTRLKDVPDAESVGSAWSERSRNRSQASLVQRGGILALSADASVLNWVLSPFAYRPSKRRMQAFLGELKMQFGGGLFAADYASQARTSIGRSKLRNCYDAVWKDHNLHSLTLYAGPAVRVGARDVVSNTAFFGRFVGRSVPAGWISMGDFDASVAKRRGALLQYYRGFKDCVGHISLPHHGSDLSFDSALLEAYPRMYAAIAPVGSNGYGHPGQMVQKEVHAAHLRFVRVDENPSSSYRVCGTVR